MALTNAMTTNLLVALVWGVLSTNSQPCQPPLVLAKWHTNAVISGAVVELDLERVEAEYQVVSNTMVTVPGVCTNFCHHYQVIGTNAVISTNVVPVPPLGFIPQRTARPPRAAPAPPPMP